jgi:hypothetical protein
MAFIYKFYLNKFFFRKSANQTNCMKKVLLVQPIPILVMFSSTFCVSLVKASLKALKMQFFNRKGVHDLAFGKPCSKDGFMFDKPTKNTVCEGKIIKKR